MNENFNLFLTEVLKHEGGFVNDPRDAGGATNKGVTIANFRRYVKADATIDDLKKLTNEQAGIIYRRFYWDAVLAAELPSGLDIAMGDYAVNSGPGRPAKAIQKIVGVKVDGRIGPETLKAIRARDAKDLIDALCDERLAFMKRAKNTKTGALLWPTYGNGWQKRVDAIRAKALSLVGKTTEEPKSVVVPEVVLPPVLKPNIPVTGVEGPKPSSPVTKKTNLPSWVLPAVVGTILVFAAIVFI